MSDVISYVDPRKLNVHPRNNEFFDDVEGVEFDRLVESIKDHGVLTPLRVTEDMTIISGHQRVKAAIKAECFSVPVVIDKSQNANDVLMKLIEANFGRMKNDSIKQAKWLKEYERLRGVRGGSTGRRKLEGQIVPVTRESIAKELGITEKTLDRLSSLLTLDPDFQEMISEGKISASTGYNLITKLSPEEQRSLLDKLPDDVKFTAKSIEERINQIRAEGAEYANNVQEQNNKLLGRIDQLKREKNELLTGTFPISEEHQRQIDDLQQKYRETYEKLKSKERHANTLQEQLNKSVDALRAAEAQVKGGDAGVIALQTEIDQLIEEKKAVERERNDLEYQLSEKDDEISALKKDGMLRSAVASSVVDAEYDERMIRSFKNKITQSVDAFQTAVNEVLSDINTLNRIEDDTVVALGEVTDLAVQAAKKLYNAIVGSRIVQDSNEDEDWSEDDMIATGNYESVSA